MSFVRMRPPEGCTNIVHQGFPMRVDADGTLMVDPRHVGDLASHGFVPANQAPKTAQGMAAERIFAADPRPAAEPAPPVDLAKAAWLNRLAALPVASLERLAALLEGDTASLGDPRAPVQPPPAAELVETGDPVPLDGKLTDEQVDRMTKSQCLAWCKANDIPTVPPIDLDVLRAKIKARQG